VIEIPADLLAAIPSGSVGLARSWWSSLLEGERAQVADLWDGRREVHFFEPQADEAGRLDEWERVPRVRGGRFIPHDDAWGLAEWGPGYFEHLLQHPELVILWEPAARTFHIGCTRHPRARACIESGAVPEDFGCPVGLAGCPSRALRGAALTRPGAGIDGGTVRASPLQPPRSGPMMVRSSAALAQRLEQGTHQ